MTLTGRFVETAPVRIVSLPDDVAEKRWRFDELEHRNFHGEWAVNGGPVIVAGDPKTAKNIVTYVPGVGSSAPASRRRWVDRMSTLKDASDKINGNTAFVLWGYNAPDELQDGMDKSSALATAGKLKDYQDKLRDDNPSAHITVVGHSYGSLVAGIAARNHGMKPDDLVFLGSPGVGSSHVSELGMPADHVWVGAEHQDIISQVADNLPLGGNPVNAAFGAREFAAEHPDEKYIISRRAHSSYFKENSEALANVDAIVRGDYDAVTPPGIESDAIEKKFNPLELRNRHGEWARVFPVNGRAALTLGDPKTAKHVVVYVPGVLSTTPDGHQRQIERIHALKDAADGYAKQHGSKDDTAFVLWGYKAPKSLESGAIKSYGKATAGKLKDYHDKLRSDNPDAHITVIGHSYGSYVAGVAASRHGMKPDDLIAIGSPGVGADKVSDLGMPADHVWVGAEKRDAVTFVSTRYGLGVNPAGSGFGARNFAAEHPQKGEYMTRHAHSTYFRSHSQALPNISAIINGDYDAVTEPGVEPTPIDGLPGMVDDPRPKKLVGKYQDSDEDDYDYEYDEYAEKALRVDTNGQERWTEDPGDADEYPAAGGGGRQVPDNPRLGELSPGGTPYDQAGGEPPRWQPSQNLTAWSDTGTGAGRAGSSPSGGGTNTDLRADQSNVTHASHPQGGNDDRYAYTGVPPQNTSDLEGPDDDGERWPQPVQEPEQAGIWEPGGTTGVPPSSSAIVKVGAEGYIHGYICVRPPCGKLPKTTLRSYDLKIQKDGGVIHQPSGYAIGHAAKNDDGSWTIHHADGTVTQHDTRAAALSAIADRHNSGKTAAGLAGDNKPEPKPAAAKLPVVKPKPEIAGKPAAAKPAATPKPVSSGSERSGDAVWKTEEGVANLSPAEKKSIANTWYSKNFINTNNYLRSGKLDVSRYYGLETQADADKFKNDIGVFQKAIAKASPFESDVILLRGVNHPEDVFGKVGSLTGKTFTDKGFTSATSNMAVGKSYSTGYGGTTALLTIHARKGSKALKVDPGVWAQSHPRKGQTPPDVLQEYTFAPGTPYKILSDTLGPDGVRRMDVEVTP